MARYAILDVIEESDHKRYRRRWKVIGVGETDYLVQPLFTDGGASCAYWNIEMCEEYTRWAWSPEPPGNICFAMKAHRYDQPCDCSEPGN
jgi:hypothetical protein